MNHRLSRVVAIVGRPNVGKSTLFNSLIAKRVSIVDDEPGVTRDRVYHSLQTPTGPVTLVDTGGLLLNAKGGIELGVKEQALLACEEASLVLLVVDGQVPPTPEDEAIARLLREGRVPVVVVANKVDSPHLEPLAMSYASLGLGEPIPVSALGRRGLALLRETMARMLPVQEIPSPPPQAVAVAIVGRPNVGKSSLLNALVGSPRALVDPSPGTTRDTVDTLLTWGSQTFQLIDTAGLRRKTKHLHGVPYYAYLRALAAMERSHVVALVMDALAQDLEMVEVKLAQSAMEAGKALCLVINKWDLVSNPRQHASHWRELVNRRLGFVHPPPLRYVSAVTKQGIEALPGAFAQMARRRGQRFSPERLAQVVREISQSFPPPSWRGRENRLMGLLQEDADYPSFRIEVSYPEGLPSSYVRFLRNSLASRLKLEGVGFRLMIVGASHGR